MYRGFTAAAEYSPWFEVKQIRILVVLMTESAPGSNSIINTHTFSRPLYAGQWISMSLVLHLHLIMT